MNTTPQSDTPKTIDETIDEIIDEICGKEDGTFKKFATEQSDTPRTDAASILMCHVVGVPCEDARKLERELTELRNHVRRKELVWQEMVEIKIKLEKSLTAMTKERDEIAAKCNESWVSKRMLEWKECAEELNVPHYILDSELRASKFREALAHYNQLKGESK